jgi:hypothetical protein
VAFNEVFMPEKYYIIPIETKNEETYIYLGLRCFTSPYPTYDKSYIIYETTYCGAMPQAFGGNSEGRNKYETIERELLEESRGVITLRPFHNFEEIHTSMVTGLNGKKTFYTFYTSSSFFVYNNNWPKKITDWKNTLDFAYQENCAVVKIKMPNEPTTKIDVLKGSKIEKDNVIGLLNNPESSLNYMNLIRFACRKEDVYKLKNCFKDFYESETFKAILKAVYEYKHIPDGIAFNNIDTYLNEDKNYNELCDLIGAPDVFRLTTSRPRSPQFGLDNFPSLVRGK